MLSNDEKNAAGCIFIVGLVFIAVAVGMAVAPWAGFALCGLVFAVIAALGIRADGKRDGE